jgi:hypothetical protein
MQTYFDEDPDDKRDTPPYSLYGVIFCMGVALAIAGSWLVHLERSDPMFW